MMELENIINKDVIETDDLGRIVITDKDVLVKINSMVFSHSKFVLPDAACGEASSLLKD